MQALRGAGIPMWDLGPDAFAKLAYGDRLDGIVGVAETPLHRLADLQLPANPLIGVIEGVEKPGNLGAILRTADGAGLSAIIVAEPGTDLLNPNIIRASHGHDLRHARGRRFDGRGPDLATGAADHDRGGARRLGSLDYTKADYRGRSPSPWAARRAGCPMPGQSSPRRRVHLPMLGVADSLNVSATAAVLFYEARRQRS